LCAPLSSSVVEALAQYVHARRRHALEAEHHAAGGAAGHAVGHGHEVVLVAELAPHVHGRGREVALVHEVHAHVEGLVRGFHRAAHFEPDLRASGSLPASEDERDCGKPDQRGPLAPREGCCAAGR
jgi:hypothetical protein